MSTVCITIVTKRPCAATNLGNTNNVHVNLNPLHNRYAWTVSDVVGEIRIDFDDNDCSGYSPSDLALVRLQ